MLSVILPLLALFFEIVALFYNPFNLPVLKVYFYLFLHLIASILLSIGLSPLFSFKKIQNKKHIIIASTLLIFLTSIIGIIFALFLFIYLLKRSKFNVDMYLENIELDDTELLSKKKRKYGEGTISSFNNKLPDNTKYEILNLVSNLRFPKMGSIIKKSLEDENDEIRLYAFNILSKEENHINSEINKKLEQVESITDNESKGVLLKEIGILYWELIFLNIVDDELNNYYLNLAKKYLNEALNYKNDDYEIYLYLGKIALREKESEKAEDFFKKVVNFNKKEKVIPYLAELHYGKKEFFKTKELLNSLKKVEIHPNFYPIYLAWIKDEK